MPAAVFLRKMAITCGHLYRIGMLILFGCGGSAALLSAAYNETVLVQQYILGNNFSGAAFAAAPSAARRPGCYHCAGNAAHTLRRGMR